MSAPARVFADMIGYPNMEAFEEARKAGLIPAPDGVLDKQAYWWPETVQATLGAHTNATHNAWGYLPAKNGGE